eukprot:TRINITY_DN9312_c0_g1_i1.p1 TRINITY_DN9312_c0_g1~~TRINITY_DN9312_c0_g1_i1.p1  ORF type:complete len:198 (-),score=12.62 TRINITY_DN9312_c0_g1_i1:61-654(-)
MEGRTRRLVCKRFPQMPVCGCTIPCRSITTPPPLLQITPDVYLGPIETAYDTDRLKSSGITHILDVSNEDYFQRPEVMQYMSIEVVDAEWYDVTQHFEATNAFISSAVSKGGATFVHCKAGISRSVSFIIAYLMFKDRMTLEQALALVRTMREAAQPNSGFLRQLHAYESHLGLSLPTHTTDTTDTTDNRTRFIYII